MEGTSTSTGRTQRLLPRALAILILLRYRSVVRRLFHGNAKRKVFMIVGVVLMSLYLLPNLIRNRAGGPAIASSSVELWLPLGLLLLTLMQLAAKSTKPPVTFSPAELDLVVPGPFSRRQLLVYQLCYQTGPLILMGLWFAIFLRTGSPFLVRAIGCMLAGQCLWYINFFFVGIVTRFAIRPMQLAVFSVVMLMLLAAEFWRALPPLNFQDLSKAIGEIVPALQTPVFAVVTAPFTAFGKILASPSLGESLPWVGIAAATNLLLGACAVAIDRGEVEAITAQSQEVIRHKQAVRSGVLIKDTATAARRSIPMAPHMKGAGVIAWRHLLEMYRLTGPILIGLIFITIVIISAGPILLLSTSPAIVPSLGAVCLLMIVVLTMIVGGDFRGDLDHLAFYRTLPISPVRMVIGQLMTPMLLVVGMLLCASLGVLIGLRSPLLWLASIGLVVALMPLIGCLLAIENTVFLFAPSRPLAQTAGTFDPARVGRHFLMSIAKFFFFGVAGVIVGLPAFAIYHFFKAPIAAGVVAYVISWAIFAGLIRACAKAFVHFDVVEDQPA